MELLLLSREPQVANSFVEPDCATWSSGLDRTTPKCPNPQHLKLEGRLSVSQAKLRCNGIGLFRLGQRQASSSRSSGPVSETIQTRKIWKHGVADFSGWLTFRDSEIERTDVATQSRTTTWCTLPADLNIFEHWHSGVALGVQHYKYATAITQLFFRVMLPCTMQKNSSKLCIECLYANTPPIWTRKGTGRTKTRVLCHMQHTATALVQVGWDSVVPL